MKQEIHQIKKIQLTRKIFINKNKNSKQMKKVLAVLAIAGTLVACNNDSETTTTEDTSSTITVDTNTTVTPITTDTTGLGTDTTATGTDTTNR